MIILEKVFISNKARVTECKYGFINNNGQSVCNLSKENKPYVLLKFKEEIGGVVINEGIGKLWGRLSSKNEIEWNWQSPGALQNAVSKGPRSYRWVINLIFYIGSETEHWLDAPENDLFEMLERLDDGYVRDAVQLGQFITREVMPYTDWRGIVQDTYTCFVFHHYCKSEALIIQTFSYHGKKVIEQKNLVVECL